MLKLKPACLSRSLLSPAFRRAQSLLVIPVLMAGALFTGCQTQPYSELPLPTPKAETKTESASLTLREGDTVKISFPGAQNLNTVQTIRRDGMLSLPLIGEYKAAGQTPAAMEKDLVAKYGPQLQTKEVNVSMENSAYTVYVTGAVLRPGKVLSDKPMSALEAIMEAGGFDNTKANLKAVKVIRYTQGRTERFNLNLKDVLNGTSNERFEVKPSDIIFVPERFSWF